MHTFNLATDQTMTFNNDTGALWAVCYGYCEENNLMSALFKSQQDNTFLEFAKTLPVTVGKESIACGDWAVRSVEREHFHMYEKIDGEIVYLGRSKHWEHYSVWLAWCGVHAETAYSRNEIAVEQPSSITWFSPDGAVSSERFGVGIIPR